ncbi:MAG: hypothetical protein ACOC0W_03725, partial [Desulfosalsimonas sp.]
DLGGHGPYGLLTREKGRIEMLSNAGWRFIACAFAAMVLCVSGCAKEEKEARLEIDDYELYVEKEEGRSNIYVINARGTVSNKGDVDAKNVEITGYCKTCGEEVVNGEWFVSEYEKMSHQKDIVGYLPAGANEEFEFEEIAFYPAPSGVPAPDGVPENHDFEIVIKAHEIAE